jgi:hypothetical protein
MPDQGARVTQAGAGDRALARTENGTEHTILAAAVASSRGLKGPTGATLVLTDLIVGTTVTLDVRKGNKVERILEVAFPDGAAEAAKEAGEEARERERKELRQRREREEAERARREAAEAHTPGSFNPYTFLPFRSHRPDPGSRPRHRTAPPVATPTLHSGRIRLRLDLASPLATFGGRTYTEATHRLESDGQGGFIYERLTGEEKGQHAEVALLRDAAGRPTLAGSSLKGTMRSWFEFITSGHRDISPQGIAWREPAINDAARVCGLLLLHERAPDGSLRPFERGITTIPPREGAHPPALPSDVVAHILPLDFRGFKEQGEPSGQGPRADHRLARFLETWDPGSGVIEHGMPLRRRGDGRGAPHAILQVGVGAAGGVVGLRVAALPGGSTLEDLRALDPTSRTDLIAVPRDALEVWFEAHRGAGGPGNDLRRQIDGTSVKVRRPDARTLRHAMPVFYRLEGNRITYLSVISGGRNAVTSIPPERYPSGLPPHEDDRLDAARRIFGRVPAGSSTGDSREHAWAGRVRIGAVRYEGDARTERFTLRALMSPKVQAAGFYLTGPKHVSWAPGKGGRLAGTKVYWHQPPVQVPGEATDIAARVRATAVATAPDGAIARTKNNSTVEALVDGSFHVDVWFEDLDENEFGALLLAVSLRFRDGGAVGWRIGMAKPLGLGSVINNVEAVELLQDAGPTALEMRALLPDDLKQRLDGARRHWFGDAKGELDVAAGIAALESVRARQFGYPAVGATPMSPREQAYPRQESASEVLSGGKSH